MPKPETDPASPPASVPEDEVDALFGLPLEDFTTGRNDLAKRIRADGDRAGATWVESLRKPTRAAWAVNQLVRSRRADARALLDAADEVARVQGAVAAGEAGADELRAASDRVQSAVQALAGTASGLLDAKGVSPSESVLEKVAETLQAAALDPAVRASVETGRLTRETRAAGLGFALGAAQPPPAAARKGRPEAKRLTELRRELDDLKDEAKTLRSRLSDVRRERARVEREATRVQRELSRAEREEEDAERSVEENRSRVEHVREEIGSLQASAGRARP